MFKSPSQPVTLREAGQGIPGASLDCLSSMRKETTTRKYRSIAILMVICTALGIVGIVAATMRPLWFDTTQEHIPPELRIDASQFDGAFAAGRRGFNTLGGGISQGTASLAGNSLAAAIRFSRQQALTAAPQPIPSDIATALRPFFPAATLRRTRWTLAGRRLSLGTVLAGWYYREGAVTLDGVIVFSDAAAASNLDLWAHELVHVRQYEELGIDTFARIYVSDWILLEQQARRSAGIITRRVEARSR